MKYTVIEHMYQHETQIKINRRHKLCMRIIKNFDYNDLEGLNYLNISKELKIERKTLYNYFPEKDELLIVIALCLLEDIHKIKYQQIKDLKQLELNDQDYLIELLYNTLDSLFFLKKTSLDYLKQFDSLSVQNKVTEKSQLQFDNGIQFIKRKYGILETELREAIKNKIIISPINQSDDDIIFTLIESGYSYQNKLLANKQLSNSDISRYLLQYVELLVFSYTQHNKINNSNN